MPCRLDLRIARAKQQKEAATAAAAARKLAEEEEAAAEMKQQALEATEGEKPEATVVPVESPPGTSHAAHCCSAAAARTHPRK